MKRMGISALSFDLYVIVKPETVNKSNMAKVNLLVIYVPEFLILVSLFREQICCCLEAYNVLCITYNAHATISSTLASKGTGRKQVQGPRT